MEVFSKSHLKTDWLIDLVTSIRSTKVNLNVLPGSFVSVSTAELNLDKVKIINDNLIVFKGLGRVSKVSNSNVSKNSVKIIVGNETVILNFDQNLDLNEQKQKITQKTENLSNMIMSLNKKLKNNSFLKNAPKNIVLKEKKSLLECEIELKKLNSILNSIKN